MSGVGHMPIRLHIGETWLDVGRVVIDMSETRRDAGGNLLVSTDSTTELFETFVAWVNEQPTTPQPDEGVDHNVSSGEPAQENVE